MNKTSDMSISREVIEIPDNFKDTVDKLLPFFEKYQDERNLEIEFRLGYLENHTFNTHIPDTLFDRIKSGLQDTDVWKKREHIIQTDYFSENLRKSVNMHTKKTKIIQKQKLCSIDFEFFGTPFDLRVSFSKENPKRKFNDDEIIYERFKTRDSYYYKNFIYDITVVQYNENNIQRKNNEIEIEIQKLEKNKQGSKSKNFTHLILSSILKVDDLTKMVEDEEKDRSLIYKREKIY